MRICLLPILLVASVCAQSSDSLQEANRLLFESTRKTFGFTFEERTRWEEKTGVNFGRAVDQQDMLSRIRIGAQYRPVEWLRISAMGQDARAPFFGVRAPAAIRETWELQESYAELFGNRKTGVGAMFGRAMLDYGESRLIGAPQWTNTARTFDHARLYYRTAKARMEVLMVSPVKILPDDFNKPELGERIWGTYNTVSDSWHGMSVDGYALRHSQNRPGGWTGAETLGTNTFGGRLYGAPPAGFAYSLEGAGQTGHLGLARQRAYAWFAGASRKINRVYLSAEYKVASGTRRGDTHTSTFDQLSPANHDKFGHLDLFGWRNIKTFKSLETVTLNKALAVNLMYTNHWLYSASDALYNGQGAVLVAALNNSAATHVGQELDAFATYKRGAHVFGAGFGHFFKGEFIERATPHVNPRYFYVFQQYSFK